MKKYKNVKAVKARQCDCYYIHSVGPVMEKMCIGVREPFRDPPCEGYCCKCTEYDKRSVKANDSKRTR
jgi:hypothetical protein